jgi:hypothetical protein
VPRALSERGEFWAHCGVVGVYLALLVGCTLSAYWAVFSIFAPYDDAGLFEYTLQLFVDGHSLYNHVFTYFGPFYYVLWGALFKVVGGSITTDRGAVIQVALWVGASFGVGISIHRLTQRFALGVIAMATTFGLLWTLVSEPMQPDSLVCALMVALLLTMAFGMPRRPRAACALGGALCCAVLLTKINVGAYALASVGFAAAMTIPALARHRLVRAVAILVFVGIGPGVMSTLIAQQWTQYAIALTLASTVSLVLVTEPQVVSDPGEGNEPTRWLAWFGTGFAALFVVVFGVIFALGSTPSAVWHSIIVIASRQSSFLTEPLNIADDAITWSIVLVGVAWGVGRARRDRSAPAPSWLGGTLRLLVGVAVLFSLVQESPFDVPGPVFALAMPLAWVAAIPPTFVVPSTRERIVRLVIPALAIYDALLAFPVAGTQVNTGSVLFVACGAICLSDGWSELVAWAGNREAATHPFVRNLGPTIGAVMAALAAVTVFEQVLQTTQSHNAPYRDGVALRAAGGDHLHLPAGTAASLNVIVADATANCKTLWSLPGMYSFNLWTELPTPTTYTGGDEYWLALSQAQQRQTLAAARKSNKLCLVLDTTQLADYGGASSTIPLISFMDYDFHILVIDSPYVLLARGKPVPTNP